MLTIIIITLITFTTDIPGATSVNRIRNPEFVRSAKNEGLIHCLLSEDGQNAFVNSGKIERFELLAKCSSPPEAVFLYRHNGKPLSVTTSQYAHLKKPPEQRIYQSADLRLLQASNANRLMLSVSTDKHARLTRLFFDKRGQKPNEDIEVARKFSMPAVAVGAKQAAWYVLQPQRSLPGQIFAVDKSGQRLVGSCGPGLDYIEYDPQSKLLVGGRGDFGVHMTKLGSKKARKVPCPHAVSPFLSRGQLFYTTSATFKRSATDWTKVGDFRVLARSATGKYWAILDSASKAWLARF
ncbi:MAG: hypothetical protein H0W86_03180 [Armatimonadetes bacterium]|nr:hypothetical protein [Armatimonadota bacterium]